MAKVGVIIPAAGSGSRMGGVYKPLEMLCGKELICYSLEVFEACSDVVFVVISAREDKIDEVKMLCEKCGFSKVKAVIAGGKDRQSSVQNAFELPLFDDESISLVAVHDAARPLISVEMVTKAFSMAEKCGSAVCASRVRDTVKRTDDENSVTAAVSRDNLWLIQTPQVFSKTLYRASLENAVKCGFVATDDSSLVSYFGERVCLCDTPSYNIKITYPDDLFLARAIIKNKE